MSDPLRRDPREFLRVLKLMSRKTSWQKCLLFGSRGRMVGYNLQLEHYNTILFSQALWGRALEIVKVLRTMEEDGVRPNGVSYYYVTHGMANAEYGSDVTGFSVNEKLPSLQHWRVALNALKAAEVNGFDPPDTMYNSALTCCVTPVTNKWTTALALLENMRAADRKVHEQAVVNLEQCLIRCMRPVEALRLRNWAVDAGINGYTEKEVDVFEHLPDFGKHEGSSSSNAAPLDPEHQEEMNIVTNPLLEGDTQKLVARTAQPFIFRPRVYKQLWWKWHAVANKYRPTDLLKRRQLAPRDSPTGIPGFSRV